MANKISNFVFLILLFLLQSCSGGKIGNFLESSFKNNNSNKISQNDFDKKSKISITYKDKKLVEKKEKNTKIKLDESIKPLNIVNSFSPNTNNENTIKKRNKNYNPKTYRVFVILKKVDPSFPTENFSKVLRNGDINFEIEKIELIPELNQNKK
tara:strand:+ start:131 stop:592 length:462 start_codon:yes stop_codon:yes gene_type:complete